MTTMKDAGAYPSIINVGVIRGTCQCSCRHCPVGVTPPAKREPVLGAGEINPEVFRLFCEQCEDTETVIRIHGIGEPTSHGRFIELLQIASQYRLRDKLWLFTNGLFPKHYRQQIIEYVGIIEFSVNSINALDYRATKGVDRFKEVIGNMIAIRELSTTFGSATRVVATRVQSDNASDRSFLEFWRERGFECFIRSRHSYAGLLKGYNEPDSEAEPVPLCEVPWRRFNLDGTLMSGKMIAVNCFNILFQHPTKISRNSIIGIFPDNSVHDIWQGEEFARYRSAMYSGGEMGIECDHCGERLTEIGPRAENFILKGKEQC